MCCLPVYQLKEHLFTNLLVEFVSLHRSKVCYSVCVCVFLLLCAGPECKRVDTLMKMMQEGMCVARLNFSHGDYEASGLHLLSVVCASCCVAVHVHCL